MNAHPAASAPSQPPAPPRPETLLGAFLLGMALLWTLACGLTHSAPDLDGMEELVWAASLELGYYKHPPLPSWLMFGLVQLFGRPVWLPFAAGMALSILALWFLWRLAREFLPVRQALIVVLITSTSTYFSMRGTVYNHNTVQLWSIAAATWLFYRALRHQRLADWAGLGIVSALATLTKYSALLQFGAFFLFMLSQGSLRDGRILRGLALASALYLLVMAPHLYWLVEQDFLPLRYADTSIRAASHWEAWQQLFYFAVDQLARLSPMLVVWLAWYAWTRRTAGPSAPAPAPYAAALRPWDRAFLRWVGLTPVLASMAVAAVLGTRLAPSWATTFFLLWGFYALWRMGGDERQALRRIAVLAIAVHLLMAVGYGLGRGPLAWHSGHDSRSTFPGARLSAAMQEVWRSHAPGHPLRVVASDTWLGGNIAIHAGPQAQVLIGGSLELSPWLDASDLACGVLVVHSSRTYGPSPHMQALLAQASATGRAELRWSSPDSPLIDLNWGVLPPGPDCPPPLESGAAPAGS